MKSEQREGENKYARAWEKLWSQYPLEYKTLRVLQDRIDYHFSDPERLFEALSHRSAVISTHKNGNRGICSQISLPWNERVEFLGDAVLNLVISTHLWNLDTNYSEGDLSRIRSSLVNEKSLAQIAREFNLADSILLGRGEEKAGGRKRDALLADTLEAVIGAVYQDGGFEAATKVIHIFFENTLARPFIHEDCDYKTRLQEWAQDAFRKTPNYKLKSHSGPDHQKEFVVAVCLDQLELAQGVGQSKKRASQNAAENALKKINTKDDLTIASLEGIFADSPDDK